MRKILKTSFVIISLLLVLSACSKDVKTHVSDKEEVIAEIKGTKITKDDIYEYGKLRFGQNLITVNLIDMQLEENVTLDAEDEKLAKEHLEEAKEAMKDDFEAIVIASGYKDVDDYYERFILRDIKNQKLFKTYLEDHVSEVVAGLHSHKIKVLKVDDKAKGEAALEELEAIEDLDSDEFVEVAKKYSNEDVVAPSKIEHVYSQRTNNKHYNTYLEEAVPGLIKENILVDDGFEIIFVEELDQETDFEMILSSIEANENVNEIVVKAMYAHYSAKGDFKIHDVDLHKLFKENNPFIVN